jgi:hypothetical protein
MVLPLILGTIGSIIGGSTALGVTGAALGYAAGSFLATILKPTKGPNVVGPRLEDLSLQTSSTAAKLPRAYGTVAHRGNMIWAKGNSLTEVSNTTTKKKKVLGFTVAKQTTTTFEYFLTCAIAFCKVPANSEVRVVRVWVGENLVINNGSDDVATILVGGKNAAQYFTFYYGTDDQQPDPLIAEDLGADLASGYPGIFYVVMKDFPLKDYLNSVSRAELKVEYTQSFTESGMAHVLNVPLPPGADDYDELPVQHNANLLDSGGLHVWRIGPGDGADPITDFIRTETLLTATSTVGVQLRTGAGSTPGFDPDADTLLAVPMAAKGTADRNVQVFTSVLMRTGGGGDGSAEYPDPRFLGSDAVLELYGFGWTSTSSEYEALGGVPAGANRWTFPSFFDALTAARTVTKGPGMLSSQPTFDEYTFEEDTQVDNLPGGVLWRDHPDPPGGNRFGIVFPSPPLYPLPFPIEESSAGLSNLVVWMNIEIWDADLNSSVTVRYDVTGSDPPPKNNAHFTFHNGVAYVAFSYPSPISSTTLLKIVDGRVTELSGISGANISALGMVGEEVVIIANNGTDAVMARYDADLTLIQSYNAAAVAALFGESDSTFYDNVGIQKDGVYFVLDGDMQRLSDFSGSPVVLGDVAATIITGGSSEDFFDIKLQGALVAVSTYGGTLPNLGAQFYTLGLITPDKVPLASIISAECALCGLEAGDIDVSDLTAEVRGMYIAGGGSVRNVIEQLQAAFPFDVVPSGYKIKFIPRGQTPVATVTWEDLAPEVTWQQSREMDSQLPRMLTLKYFDPAIEYEVNSQPSERPLESYTESVVEIPVVLSADEAAQAIDVLHSVYLVERVEYGTFTLPPPFRGLEPADVITVQLPDATYQVRLETVQYLPNGSLQCTGVPNAVPIYTSNAVGQAPAPLPDTIAMAGPIFTILLDTPTITSAQNAPGITVAMSGIYANWGGGVLWGTTDQGQTWTPAQGFSSSVAMGITENALEEHGCHLPDLASTLTVQLYTGTLTTVSEADFYNEEFLIAYGAPGRWEIIAVRTATDNGDGNYTLSTFLRGLRGSEWTTGLHVVGDYVVLLTDPDIAFVGLTTAEIDTLLTFRAVNTGGTIDNVPDTTLTYAAENLTPLSPVYASAATDGSHNMTIKWTRRDRVDAGWENFSDVPMSEETLAFEIDIYDALGSTVVRTLEATEEEVIYTATQQIADFGTTVQQVQVAIYQMSAAVGRGHPLEATLEALDGSTYTGWTTVPSNCVASLSNFKLTRSGGANSVRGSVHSVGKTAGKYAIRYLVMSTGGASAQGPASGVNVGTSIGTFLGQLAASMGFWPNNVATTADFTYNNNVGVNRGNLGSFATDTEVMVEVDINTGKVWVGVAGTWIGGGDPVAGTGQTYTLAAGTYYPVCDMFYPGSVQLLRPSEFITPASAGFTPGWPD